MLKRICFKAGPRGTGAPLDVAVAPLTILVGPNDSGKSLTLREIESLATEMRAPPRRVVDRITVEFPPEPELRRLLESRILSRHPGDSEAVVRLFNLTGQGDVGIQGSLDRIVAELSKAQPREISEPLGNYPSNAVPQVLKTFSVRLDGITRLGLLNDQEMGDLLIPPRTTLMALFTDDSSREELRRIVAETFKRWLVIDPTGAQRLRVRLSNVQPANPAVERALTNEAIEFHRAASLISEAGDGVRAFAGILAVLLASDHRIVFLDEPEAFLHPPLRRRLGREIAALAARRGADVVVATHSAEFLEGCISAGEHRVGIVRLTHENGAASATSLSADDLGRMLRDPMVRSTNVLQALFHRAVIVCEGDADRVFYQYVNDAAVITGGFEPISDVLFLSAIQKQKVRDIVGPLRSLGIPTAAIVDLDAIKDSDFSRLLKAAQVPEAIALSIGQLRGQVKKYYEMKGKDPKRAGLEALTGDERLSAEQLLSLLNDHGIFLVPCGELEGWVASEGGHSGSWLASVFRRWNAEDGEQPSDSSIAEIRKVAEFLGRIGRWIANAV